MQVNWQNNHDAPWLTGKLFSKPKVADTWKAQAKTFSSAYGKYALKTIDAHLGWYADNWMEYATEGTSPTYTKEPPHEFDPEESVDEKFLLSCKHSIEYGLE